MGSPVGGVGGYYIVAKSTKKGKPKTKLWNAWRKALRTDFRFAFPFMTTEEIHDHLRRGLSPSGDR
jgi:hypothetical protein